MDHIQWFELFAVNFPSKHVSTGVSAPLLGTQQHPLYRTPSASLTSSSAKQCFTHFFPVVQSALGCTGHFVKMYYNVN